MTFADHEKAVYAAPSGGKHDPLAVLRALTLATGGRLADLLGDWREAAADPVAAAHAEERLAAAARRAFGHPGFPDVTDGAALEDLCDFLWYVEGNGSRGKPPPTSTPPTASPAT